MQALFIGQTYIDVTFLTDRMPTGDEKHVASAYAVSFGGNAVTAAFCCAKLGLVPDLLTTVADDWLGRMFLEMVAKYGISIHVRKVRTSSLSFIMPNDGKRAIVRCRDDDYIHPFQKLERSFTLLADNEQWLSDNHDKTLHAPKYLVVGDAPLAATLPVEKPLAAEEEHVLRCLGAALIMQWNTLPTKLRRELFDSAGAMGDLLDTVELRGQIARFLHKHKDDEA